MTALELCETVLKDHKYMRDFSWNIIAGRQAMDARDDVIRNATKLARALKSAIKALHGYQVFGELLEAEGVHGVRSQGAKKAIDEINRICEGGE